MDTKPRRSRQKGAPPPEPTESIGINLPAPTPLPPELTEADEPVDDPPTNPNMIGTFQLAGAPLNSLGSKTKSDELAKSTGPRLNLSPGARAPMPRATPIEDDFDEDDGLVSVVLEELPFTHDPPIQHVWPPPTPVEVTLDSVDETPATIPDPDPESAPSPVASQLDDMLGPTNNAPKDLKMTQTVPPPASAPKPVSIRIALAGCVTVVAVLLAVGAYEPTNRSDGQTQDDAPPTDEIAVVVVPDRPAEIPTPAIEDTGTPKVPDADPETVATAEIIEPVVEPTKDAAAVAPEPVAAPKVAATVPPAPLPAPKATLTESLVVSATGLKPACKAACAWANVDPKDGFPYTVNGKRDVTCGDVTYSVAKWTKIAEGKERFCVTATGLSEEPAGP